MTPLADPPTGMVSLPEAAARLGIHERTIRRAIARGEILAIKRGRALAISRASLERYATRDRTGPRRRSVQRAQAAPPMPLTSFIGRDQLVVELSRLVQHGTTRLVTLIGPGGVGKTRLALQVLERSAASFADGAVFVPLASVTDPALVMPMIARTLGLAPTEERTPAEQVQRVLTRAQLLLVLDNLEQVREAGPELAALVASCPGLVVLVTSRVRLQVTGEQCVPVPPLTLPLDAPPPYDGGETGSLRSMAQAEAVRLFVDRARAVAPDMALTPANASDIAAICHRLDGLPLALELAAARLRHLHPADLRSRVDHALPLLTGGPRDAPVRLQTMRAAIAWSYDLLPPHLQALFRWLAVFVGGFEGDAVAAIVRLVCAADNRNSPADEWIADDADTVLEGLSVLVDQSLLQQATTPESRRTRPTTRYVLLETVREYGLEQVAAEGEEERVRDAHADWCLALARTANDELTGPAQAAWFARLDLEQANFRAALTWLLARADSARGFGLLRALSWFWTSRGYLREAAQWASAFLALPTAATDPARGWVLLENSTIAHWLGDTAAAVTHDEAALAHFEAAGDQLGVGYARRSLGSIAIDRGAPDEAAAHLAASDAILLPIGTPWDAAFARFLAGRLAMVRGQSAEAIQHFAEAAAAFGALGDHEYVAAARCRQAAAFVAQGDLGQARQAYRDGLALAHALAQPYWMAWGLSGAAYLALQVGQRAQASRLYAATNRLLEETGLQWPDDAVCVALDAQVGTPALVSAAVSPQAALDRALREATTVLAGDASSAAPLRHGPLLHLTPREREVLALLAQGLTDKEIANVLQMARHTAVNHVAAIRRKLGVPSRAAAVAVAIRHGQLGEE
jgi:excisionase family DNA binding protein